MVLVGFDEGRVERQIVSALEKVDRILADTRFPPKVASEVDHTYVDKFALAETLINTWLSAVAQSLEVIAVPRPIPADGLLRFNYTVSCSFARKVVKDVERTDSSILGIINFKTITTVTEYWWQVAVHSELLHIVGDNRKTLLQSNSLYETVTSVEQTPFPEMRIFEPLDFVIGDLALTGEDFNFKIDRNDPLCHTPRRNPQVKRVLQVVGKLDEWLTEIQQRLMHPTKRAEDLALVTTSTLFVPLAPLFLPPKDGEIDEKTKDAVVPVSEGVTPLGDTGSYLREQAKTIGTRLEELQKTFAAEKIVVPFEDVRLSLVSKHVNALCQAVADGLDYVEHMLRSQLIAAIGKEIGSFEFYQYMLYHNRKLFLPEYEPQPFALAVRRPDHYPDGILSVEMRYFQESKGKSEPIYATVKQLSHSSPVGFEINSGTSVTCMAGIHVHSWINYQFSNSNDFEVCLNARARQFSCFMLLVGNILSDTEFSPKFGMIIKNKDELTVPLEVSRLPSAKDFKAAVKSLSPEQESFAKAFRSMQLESTLFGICIIQIKPQLEKLLGLPDDSLTKEIRLTQDLIDLFVEYQIPSDLLSYAGEEDVESSSKVEFVQNQVTAMQTLINAARQKELDEKRLQDEVRARTELHVQKQVWRRSSIQAQSYQKKAAVAYDDGDEEEEDEGDVGGGGLYGENESDGEPPDDRKAADDEQEEAKDETHDQKKQEELGEAAGALDVTQIPKTLDEMYLEYDEDNAIRPNIIKAGSSWELTQQESLLVEPQKTVLTSEQQQTHRNRCFDLLDSLSKSGSLSFDRSDLHILIGATHCFDKNLIETVIQDNINPIERVEFSSLLTNAVVQQKPAVELIKSSHASRLEGLFPKLFKPLSIEQKQ
eukprot:TRINITY_DN10054_c0_g1_i1.p1 TRINITY_DN10054_c0_g1~~TRINITY_DN10054_c0_g1_i1.p1  ORF type:complete len:879 (+),score=239.00 TRINITY_DN10054_c0_g1_i1:43-2679(+)